MLAGIAENDGELRRREEKTKEKWKIESEKEEKLGFWGQITGHRRSHHRKNESSGGGRREATGMEKEGEGRNRFWRVREEMGGDG